MIAITTFSPAPLGPIIRRGTAKREEGALPNRFIDLVLLFPHRTPVSGHPDQAQTGLIIRHRLALFEIALALDKRIVLEPCLDRRQLWFL